MTAPHLPPDVPTGARPERVVPLLHDLGEVAGHRLTLLSLEVWPGFADLRFARVSAGADRPLPRRVPPPGAWRIAVDGEPAEVWDAVGRGDRDFSNGEVRLRPAPQPGAEVHVSVDLLPGGEPLTGTVTA
ncbi:hypothetical protein [Nitriliruptor alkaliphilus]|uniref:hypothetical protein n=1 Tax=Nitriliruptor alkaliphilus TaxID=427918 RepID=UPI000698C3E2|nr:hypothetical protein [Nitriliruptor alkaliphilus]